MEEIEVRFDDEAPETISAYRIHFKSFGLLNDEELNKETGNADLVELAKKLTKHGKFRLRHRSLPGHRMLTSTLRYDQANAKAAIGKVLGHCGYELASETTTTEA